MNNENGNLVDHSTTTITLNNTHAEIVRQLRAKIRSVKETMDRYSHQMQELATAMEQAQAQFNAAAGAMQSLSELAKEQFETICSNYDLPDPNEYNWEIDAEKKIIVITKKV